MLQNNELDVTDFIKITSAGVDIATYAEVRSALIRRYMSVYGEDIDLSTGTADGIFVSNLALIINNILQSFKILYSNLDVNTASGVYLDALCRLSNVKRKEATNSYAQLTVKNIGMSQLTVDKNTTFVDKSGIEWIYKDESFGLQVEEMRGITVYCKEVGQIIAPANWIDKTLEVSYLQVLQSNAAVVGTEQESDADLRARRASAVSSSGNTVLETLVGALLELNSVEDVKIYENVTNSSSTGISPDGNSIDAHSVYIVLRRTDGLYLDEDDKNTNKGSSTIGNLIHSKLTPGISTTQAKYTDTYHAGRVFTYEQGIKTTTTYDDKLYWEEAKPASPAIKITITPLEYFSEEELDTIGNELIRYLNGLRISEDIKVQQLLIQSLYADPRFKTLPTYNISLSDILINNSNSDYTNPATYFNYNKITKSEVKSDGTYDITLTREA